MKIETVCETKLPLPLVNRGKVRDIYAAGEDKLLIVTTDRLSAFDVVLPTPVPDKGRVLNQISLFWFEKFKSIVSNHILCSDVEKMNLERCCVRISGPQLPTPKAALKLINLLLIEILPWCRKPQFYPG